MKTRKTSIRTVKVLMLALIAIVTVSATAQEHEKPDYLVIKGKFLDMSAKYTKILIFEGSEASNDTVRTIHCNKPKFELPSLNVHKDYTIVFVHDGKTKSIYIAAARRDAIAVYYMRLLVSWDFGDEDNNLGVAEYNSNKDKYVMTYSWH